MDQISRVTSLSARRVMLVGGGRWGRVHAGVLTQILPPGSEVLWVSRHNQAAASAFLEGKSGRTSTTLADDIEHALIRKPDAAIIVTAAHTHAAMARAALEHGVPTLVEKPFVLTRKDADELIELARVNAILLGVGLHLLFASYLRHFRSLWRERVADGAQIAWLDCETETRYGETKRADVSTPRVHDVYPHLWAVMHVLWPGQPPSVRDVESLPVGGARLHMTAGNISVEADIGRRAPARARRITVSFQDGGSATLDFTSEPGWVSIDGKAVECDPDWARQPTPIALEVSSFLAASAQRRDWPGLAENVIGSVIGAEDASDKLSVCDARNLASLIAGAANPAFDPDIQALLIDNLAPELNSRGQRITELAQQSALVRSALWSIDPTRNTQPSDVPSDLSHAVANSKFLQLVART